VAPRAGKLQTAWRLFFIAGPNVSLFLMWGSHVPALCRTDCGGNPLMEHFETWCRAVGMTPCQGVFFMLSPTAWMWAFFQLTFFASWAGRQSLVTPQEWKFLTNKPFVAASESLITLKQSLPWVSGQKWFHFQILRKVGLSATKMSSFD